MDAIERVVARLMERLSAENRRLLALLRLGYSLRRAELLLDERVGPPRAEDPPGTVKPGNVRR